MSHHAPRYTINHRSESETKYKTHEDFHRNSVGVVEMAFTGEEIEFLSQLSRSRLKNKLYINSTSKELFNRIEESYAEYCNYNQHDYKKEVVPVNPINVVIFN